MQEQLPEIKRVAFIGSPIILIPFLESFLSNERDVDHVLDALEREGYPTKFDDGSALLLTQGAISESLNGTEDWDWSRPGLVQEIQDKINSVEDEYFIVGVDNL